MLHSSSLFSNLDIWYLFCLHILSFDTTCTNALNRCLLPRLLSICYHYCHLPTLPPPLSAHSPSSTSTAPLNSHSDLWLLILYLSARRTGAREMTCFRLGWKDTQTRARTQASETASHSQCNYGETEQSVTHLSAAQIRARVLLWHRQGKLRVRLLKHVDRQLHLQTWLQRHIKYL